MNKNDHDKKDIQWFSVIQICLLFAVSMLNFVEKRSIALSVVIYVVIATMLIFDAYYLFRLWKQHKHKKDTQK